MKPQTLFAMALAGTLACSLNASAGRAQPQNGAEVQTPSSVSESGPSQHDALAMGPHSRMSASNRAQHEATMSSSSNVEYWRMDEQPSEVGASSGASASGTVRFDSTNPGVQ